MTDRQLHQRLAQQVQAWRAGGYACADFPAIGEILDYQLDPGAQGTPFLRDPQVRALETYWYLRLVARTPRIIDLYAQLFPDVGRQYAALGLAAAPLPEYVAHAGLAALRQYLHADADFVRTHRLAALRETLSLAYPSYILALAMGTGKTVLIGAIIATEFALALEYPAAPFVQNALVFAPGKTILASLRELLALPYDRILPPRFARRFAASVKFTVTRDAEKDLPLVPQSFFNVVVTNTEKIRIRKESVRKSMAGRMRAPQPAEAARAEVANLRLQTLAGLPHLAVFSDEAHHTYGPAMGRDLKRVRQTVDYLHQHSPNLICVVNTTGTPYFERQLLRDVVFWYGLSAGIADGILKDVSGNILAYQAAASDAAQFVSAVIADFFRDYADVRLPDGTAARLAIYLPRVADLDELQPVVEHALAAVGQPPSVVLRNTSRSPQHELDAFQRLNDPDSPHRVILLVNKGTEGWNCPGLFACALARRLKGSNTFVLQAATRCLRQVPGNQVKARIYLTPDNRDILERQLRETYGETLASLERTQQLPRRTATPVSPPPPQVPRVEPWAIRRADGPVAPLRLQRPAGVPTSGLTRAAFTLAPQASGGSSLVQTGAAESVAVAAETLDLYTAAVRLAANYYLDLWAIYDELRRLYPDGALPVAHVPDLARQIEAHVPDLLARGRQIWNKQR